MQYSVEVRNAKLDAFETTVGTSPILTIRSGSAPSNTSSANSGTPLATITLPSDWLNPASGGTKTINGSWVDSSADATGTAAHFRIHNSAGTRCDAQGTVGTSGADLIVDSVSFTAGQNFSILTFTISSGNA